MSTVESPNTRMAGDFGIIVLPLMQHLSVMINMQTCAVMSAKRKGVGGGIDRN